MSEADEEYEIQHYGFSIAELKKETADMIADEVDNACVLLVESIAKSPQVDGEIAAEIERKKNNLANNIKELLKDSLDEMGSITTEHFTIPANVTLKDDQMKLKPVDTDERSLESQLDELLKVFARFEQYCTVMNDELAAYKKMEPLILDQMEVVEVAELDLSAQPTANYIKEQVAIVNTKFQQNLNSFILFFNKFIF